MSSMCVIPNRFGSFSCSSLLLIFFGLLFPSSHEFRASGRIFFCFRGWFLHISSFFSFPFRLELGKGWYHEDIRYFSGFCFFYNTW